MQREEGLSNAQREDIRRVKLQTIHAAFLMGRDSQDQREYGNLWWRATLSTVAPAVILRPDFYSPHAMVQLFHILQTAQIGPHYPCMCEGNSKESMTPVVGWVRHKTFFQVRHSFDGSQKYQLNCHDFSMRLQGSRTLCDWARGKEKCTPESQQCDFFCVSNSGISERIRHVSIGFKTGYLSAFW